MEIAIDKLQRAVFDSHVHKNICELRWAGVIALVRTNPRMSLAVLLEEGFGCHVYKEDQLGE